MGQVRRWVGALALTTYLVMGAHLYLIVLPGAGGLWPPDFHLRGYSVETIAPFVTGLTFEGRAAYLTLLVGWDRVFIVSFALWLALTGWRGGGVRFVVAGLAAIYAMIDLAENAAIHAFMERFVLEAAMVSAASSLTMAKFASLYLCILVLIWHVRGSRGAV